MCVSEASMETQQRHSKLSEHRAARNAPVEWHNRGGREFGGCGQGFDRLNSSPKGAWTYSDRCNYCSQRVRPFLSGSSCQSSMDAVRMPEDGPAGEPWEAHGEASGGQRLPANPFRPVPGCPAGTDPKSFLAAITSSRNSVSICARFGVVDS